MVLLMQDFAEKYGKYGICLSHYNDRGCEGLAGTWYRCTD